MHETQPIIVQATVEEIDGLVNSLKDRTLTRQQDDDLILVEGRFARTKKQIERNEITRESFLVELNRIRQILLVFSLKL